MAVTLTVNKAQAIMAQQFMERVLRFLNAHQTERATLKTRLVDCDHGRTFARGDCQDLDVTVRLASGSTVAVNLCPRNLGTFDVDLRLYARMEPEDKNIFDSAVAELSSALNRLT